MRFYKNKKYTGEPFDNTLTAVYHNTYSIRFFKNGENHNTKNAGMIYGEFKEFWLNGRYYGNQNTLTKKSWRRYMRLIKLKAFL